jgi:phosphoribosylaminoimidazolecarboxamide formyltransferase/IMP cyclohydrolase
MDDGLPLRYGLNPHQGNAYAVGGPGGLPFTVRNGAPGYLNLLDALTGWQIVRDGRAVLDRPVAASIKHAGPNGVGTDVPLSEAEAIAYAAPADLSPVALAYARARGTDRVAGYGDLIALSDQADESFAESVRVEATNGVIAPSFTGGALDVLKRKRDGAFLVLQADPDYAPPRSEERAVFGVTLRQDRNEERITADLLAAASDPTDLLLATLAARYAQSNAICLAVRGQTVGIGAGQPSRIQATRLARTRAEEWFLRQHPALRAVRRGHSLSRHDLDTAIGEFVVWHELHPAARERLLGLGVDWPTPLDADERAAWLDGLSGLALSSDGPLPFPDSLHVAAGVGVRHVAQPGGSRRDAEVAAAASRHGMAMVSFGSRLFQH